jgi:hypothetical protein
MYVNEAGDEPVIDKLESVMEFMYLSGTLKNPLSSVIQRFKSRHCMFPD